MTALDALIAIACPSLATWEPDPRWPFGEPPSFDETFPDFAEWAMRRIAAMGIHPANDGATPAPVPALAVPMATRPPRHKATKRERQPFRPAPAALSQVTDLDRARARRALAAAGIEVKR